MSTWAVVSYAVFFVLGILVALLFSASSSGKKQPKKEEPIPHPSPPILEGKTLLRLWKDDNGRLRLALDGKPVPVSEISPVERRRLVTLINALRPWVDTRVAAPAAPSAPPPPPPAPKREAAAPPPPSSEEKDSAAPAKPLSMVEEIDEILQEKLAHHPLKNRGIRLVESPTGGVIVYVGLQRYEMVADIPDSSIQAIIRESIAEWEERSTPK